MQVFARVSEASLHLLGLCHVFYLVSLAGGHGSGSSNQQHAAWMILEGGHKKHLKWTEVIWSYFNTQLRCRVRHMDPIFCLFQVGHVFCGFQFGSEAGRSGGPLSPGQSRFQVWQLAKSGLAVVSVRSDSLEKVWQEFLEA